MEYSVIEDPEATAKASLVQRALQEDELAYLAEFRHEEASQIQPTSLAAVNERSKLEVEAVSKRRQANAFIEASEVSERSLLEGRKAFLLRLIHSLEHSHVTHAATLKVHEQLGQPTASHNSILETLERGHDLAIKKLNEIQLRLDQMG